MLCAEFKSHGMFEHESRNCKVVGKLVYLSFRFEKILLFIIKNDE
jgi:hypothetical protein